MSKPTFNYYKLLDDRKALLRRFEAFHQLLNILQGSEDEYPTVLRCIVDAVDDNVQTILDIDEKLLRYQETSAIRTSSINYLRS